MGSTKEKQESPAARDRQVPCDSVGKEPSTKPIASWLVAPQKGLFYLCSILFLGWLGFLSVIAYMVNFQ